MAFSASSTDDCIHILIYRTGGIGDVILSTVSLDLIFKMNRPTKVYWVSFESTSELIQRSYPAVKTIRISRENTYRENMDEILSHIDRLDVVIDLQRSPRSIILCQRVAGKHRASYSTWNKGSIRRTKKVMRARIFGRRGKFPKSNLEDEKARNQLMSSCVRRALSPFVSAFDFGHAPQLPDAESSERPDFMKQAAIWIAVAAGGLHEAKWAPTHVIKSVLEEVKREMNAEVGLVLFGDENDLPPSEQVIAALEGKFKIQNQVNMGSLYGAASLMRHCDAALCNDTALAHMAEAVNLDVAMLFGPTVEAFGYSPWRSGSKAFSAELSCRPCTKDGNTTCRYGDKHCFERIDPQDVARFLIQRLKKKQLEKA